MGGQVTLFNTSGTEMAVTVNGPTVFTISGTNPTNKWVPNVPATNPTRSDSGQPADGQFGQGDAVNHVVVREKSGRGEAANFEVTIKDDLQSFNALEMYLFYSGDPEKASWVLLFQGAPIAAGNVNTQMF